MNNNCAGCFDCVNCIDCFNCRNCNGCVGLLGAVDAKDIDMRSLLTDEQWRAAKSVFLASGLHHADVLVDRLAAPYVVDTSWLRRYLENYT